MLHTGVCKRCGKTKEYKYKSWIKEFCSHKCSNIYKWENTISSAESIKITCINCDNVFIKQKSFIRQHPNTKFCSRECNFEFLRKNSNSVININCNICKKKFNKRRDKILEKNFCSIKCRSDGRKK